MKLIYTNENSFIVNNIKNIIENKNIEVFLKNEFASGGSGDLSPLDTWVELWVVRDKDYDQAMAIINDFQNTGVSCDWTCLACGEENGEAFEYCWNCQSHCPT
jgi:hypothetical protein